MTGTKQALQPKNEKQFIEKEKKKKIRVTGPYSTHGNNDGDTDNDNDNKWHVIINKDMHAKLHFFLLKKLNCQVAKSDILF